MANARPKRPASPEAGSGGTVFGSGLPQNFASAVLRRMTDTPPVAQSTPPLPRPTVMPRRQPHLLVLLTASFLMFTGSYVVDQAFRWSDPIEGIASGLFHVFFTGIAWLFSGLVPGLVVASLYRWRGWRRFRTVAITATGIAALALTIAGLIFDPTTPAGRLKDFAGAELPSSARDLHTHFSGGGIADYSDYYYFRCEAADTEALIRALHLKIDESSSGWFEKSPFPGWPNPTDWVGSTLYAGDRDNHSWFYYLRTDATREQVYLFIGCI